MAGADNVETPGQLPAEIIRWLHEVAPSDLPAEVVDFAKRCLLDLIGVAAAGRTTQLSSLIHQHAADHFGPGRYSVPLLFDGRPVSPVGAARAAGMTID